MRFDTVENMLKKILIKWCLKIKYLSTDK